MLHLSERIEILTKLGDHLFGKDEYLEAIMSRTHYNNQWFTIENQKLAVENIAKAFLQKELLEKWVANYKIPDENSPKTIGLVMAGNIPLVGFHDVLSVFISGNKAQIKLSEKDKFLLPYLIKLLTRFNPAATDYFEIVEKLTDFDAVIATGSNNSARYFEVYFGKVPNIIRKNRNAVAVFDGKESAEDLANFGEDVFQYYGLGCRNVSKIYVPKGYQFEPLLEALHEFRKIVLNTKYKNNFDYNYALFLLNKVPMHNNGCIIITENQAIQSRIANLHYEFYDDLTNLEVDLFQKKEEIQCVVAREGVLNKESISFGGAQQPSLGDYADGVDTMDFLVSL